MFIALVLACHAYSAQAADASFDSGAPTLAIGAAALPRAWAALQNDAALLPEREPQPDNAQEIERYKSYVIPALDIVGFEILLNLVNRRTSGDYHVSGATIRRNLRSSWTVDSDPFRTNQLGHPYSGSMYHGFARSAGLDFWESFGYTFAGSALWEIAGENTPPSRNDQISTGIGGAFLGEVLFRLSNLVLEHENIPPLWREVAAAIVSPATGFNRLAFGDRFKSIFPAHDPVYYSRLQIGFGRTSTEGRGASTTDIKRNEALIDYAIDYGLPGKPGYTYTRPFDYFSFQSTASTANGFENLLTRGLLIGQPYGSEEKYRGIWGLYGSYDYIAPQTFRVSSTALSLGTTGQWKLPHDFYVQGTLLGGAGYAAAGTVDSKADNDYHYGIAPQALLAFRLIDGERAALDLTAREYFVSHVAAAARGGHDNIVRLDAALTLRIHGRHGIALRYLWNRRDAFYPDVGDSSQKRATIGLFYTFLGHQRFGAVDY